MWLQAMSLTQQSRGHSRRSLGPIPRMHSSWWAGVLDVSNIRLPMDTGWRVWIYQTLEDALWMDHSVQILSYLF